MEILIRRLLIGADMLLFVSALVFVGTESFGAMLPMLF